MANLAVIYILLCLFVWTGMGQITTVNYMPEITPYNFAGKVTASTVILKQPRCYFDNIPNLPCTSNSCEVWLVPAINSGVNNFDADKTNINIVSLSPYPSAFTSNNAKNYFLTQVGLQNNFPCSPTPGIVYFRVGADGSCSTTNCNGILPAGSNSKFKYLLINPSNNTILAETLWSNSIILYSLTDSSTINDGIGGRSAGMIVLTSILSVLLALLFLLLLAMLIYYLYYRYNRERMPSLGSLRVSKYDTHHMKSPLSYVNPTLNPTYEDDIKKYKVTEVVQMDT